MPITSEIFKRYLTSTLIETGSYEGDGIQAGIDAGFPSIYSIDLSKEAVDVCRSKFFKLRHRVHPLWGDSSYVLELLLERIKLQCTFWLDAHISQAPLSIKVGEMTALVREIEAIAGSPIKNHIILIDDVRCFGTKDFAFLKEDDVKERILKINPAYRFSYEDGYHWRTDQHFPKDILVAKV